jgi:hypothetical protein
MSESTPLLSGEFSRQPADEDAPPINHDDIRNVDPASSSIENVVYSRTILKFVSFSAFVLSLLVELLGFLIILLGDDRPPKYGFPWRVRSDLDVIMIVVCAQLFFSFLFFSLIFIFLIYALPAAGLPKLHHGVFRH